MPDVDPPELPPLETAPFEPVPDPVAPLVAALPVASVPGVVASGEVVEDDEPGVVAVSLASFHLAYSVMSCVMSMGKTAASL